MAKKDYQNKASEKVNNFINDNNSEQSSELDISEINNKKKVNIMLRLDPVLGAKIKEKARINGLPSTKYIEQIIRKDLGIIRWIVLTLLIILNN